MARRVTVVDDDREVRELLGDRLRRLGYEVKVVSNGLRLVSTLHVDRPDLILLDVMMSWIDGFELCRSLKQNDEFRAIPVVFISGKTSPDDMERGISCGAVDYFPKPLDVERLLERVGEIIGPPS
ncbi:MAG TPA: response regulator [Haliangiales bacterium]|nr:response regulator [Haliangiales bacterium]